MVQLVTGRLDKYGLRSYSRPMDYCVSRIRTEIGERSFASVGPIAWNNLPLDIRREQKSAFKGIS